MSYNPIVIGGGTEAAAQRVTIATDSTGVVSVDDNGSSITVDGDVRITDGAGIVNTKQIGTAITASDVGLVVQSVIHGLSTAGGGTYVDVKVNPSGALATATTLNDGTDTALVTSAGELNVLESNSSAIKTAVETIDNAISGNEMQVDVVGSLPAGTNAIGKLAANSGVDIGDVDVTSAVITGGAVAHGSGDSGNPIKIGFKAETSPKGITLVADGYRTDAYADADGLLMVKLNTSGADVISEAVSNTDGASTAFTNFSAVANTKNYITSYNVFRTDAGTTPIYVDFRDGTSGSVLYRAVIPPNSGSNSPPCAGPALFKTSANTALAFDVSAATTTVYISVSGYQSKV